MQCNKAPGTIKKPNRSRFGQGNISEPKANPKKTQRNARKTQADHVQAQIRADTYKGIHFIVNAS